MSFLERASTAAAAGDAVQRVYIGTYTDGDSRGIYLGELDTETGALAIKGLAAELKNPSFLAIHPSGRWLYAVSEVDEADFQGGAVAALAIDPADGSLELLNYQSSTGAGPCHVVVDPSGQFALVANYGGGSIAALPIGEDGRLAPASASIKHEGSSVNRDRQEAAHAHSINVDPTGRFAAVADLGLDKVLCYRLDAATGSLAANDPPGVNLPPGSGPRHLAFHPNGRLALVINELKSTITSLRYDGRRGAFEAIETVTTLPEDAEGENWTAEVQIHPSGQWAYGSNRGHDSIAMFAVDAESGRLTALGHQPTGGSTPRNFGIDPSGRWLLAANQNSGTITVHRIDADTGRLEATDHVARVPKPVCVKFYPAAATTTEDAPK